MGKNRASLTVDSLNAEMDKILPSPREILFKALKRVLYTGAAS